MTATIEEIKDHIASYRQQYEQNAKMLEQLDAAYQMQKQEITTSMYMCAGAIQAFEQLVTNIEAEQQRLTGPGFAEPEAAH